MLFSILLINELARSAFIGQVTEHANCKMALPVFNRSKDIKSKVNNLTEGKPYALVNDKTVTYFSFYHLFVWNSKEF